MCQVVHRGVASLPRGLWEPPPSDGPHHAAQQTAGGIREASPPRGAQPQSQPTAESSQRVWTTSLSQDTQTVRYVTVLFYIVYMMYEYF